MQTLVTCMYAYCIRNKLKHCIHGLNFVPLAMQRAVLVKFILELHQVVLYRNLTFKWLVQLEILCTCQFHAPPREGEDLTNWVVKCPTPGANPAVKSPLCPQVLVGIWQHILAKYCTIATSNSSECDPMPLSATSVLNTVNHKGLSTWSTFNDNNGLVVAWLLLLPPSTRSWHPC